MPPLTIKKTDKLKKRRNSDATREAILKAARTVLAKDGSDGLSVLRVARLAGINRGTTYMHFPTREDLVKATVESVSTQLCNAVFGDMIEEGDGPDIHEASIFDVINHLVEFAADNPELGRIWLFEILASKQPADDPFFKHFKSGFERLAESEQSQDDIDVETLSVLMLAGYFLWPVWIGSHARSKEDRKAMAKRMSREVLRLSQHGIFRPGFFPEVEELLES